jgi:hypothetical protein
MRRPISKANLCPEPRFALPRQSIGFGKRVSRTENVHEPPPVAFRPCERTVASKSNGAEAISRGRSLVAERFDRVKARSFDRRIGAKENPHAH